VPLQVGDGHWGHNESHGEGVHWSSECQASQDGSDGSVDPRVMLGEAVRICKKYSWI
jgi:hypothetical protein